MNYVHAMHTLFLSVKPQQLTTWGNYSTVITSLTRRPQRISRNWPKRLMCQKHQYTFFPHFFVIQMILLHALVSLAQKSPVRNPSFSTIKQISFHLFLRGTVNMACFQRFVFLTIITNEVQPNIVLFRINC